MLHEKISYPYDFPMQITISEITEDPLHYHYDVELVYVLRGELQLKSGSQTYLLSEGSIFASNGREVHALYETEQSNVTAILQFNTQYFSQHFPALSRSVFRTWTPEETDSRYGKLREILLGLLLTYLKKDAQYRQNCTEEAITLIRFLNRNFNLFSFEDNQVLSPNYDNLVLIERMSRIIPYIYEHHNEKISLKELADMEHLSTYYLSHMFKTCTGLSFREFLSFARVEFSEMHLLESEEKIHSIAKKIGFSTTAYYEKFFRHWFGTSPQEHRAANLPLVKSPLRQLQSKPVDVNTAVDIVRYSISALGSHSSIPQQSQHFRWNQNIDTAKRPLVSIAPHFTVSLSVEDCKILGAGLHDLLRQLHCTNVILRISEETSDLSRATCLQMLEQTQYTVTVQNEPPLAPPPAYGLDSIASLISLTGENLLLSRPVELKLRDQGNPSELVHGDSGLLTASGIPKPAWYGALLLTRLHGDLIAHDKHYAVVRTKEENPSFLIIVLHGSDQAARICSQNTTLLKVQDMIDRFNHVLDLSLNLHTLQGKYAIKRYTFSNDNSFFHYMERLNFPEDYTADSDFSLASYTAPDTELSTESVSDVLTLNFSLRGLGLQFVQLEPLG